MKKALIIGGGPAGLTAAYELLKHTNIQPVVVEATDLWGGISRTEIHNGNRIDIGGHRFFSKSDIVMQWWQEILPIHSTDDTIQISYQNQHSTIKVNQNKEDVEDVFLVRKRVSRIFYQKSFYDYPIRLSFQTIRQLGFKNVTLIILSYLKSVLFPIKNEKSLEDFFINRFGNRLYKTFFKDYTEKVWGISCKEISSEWGAQRIKGLSITKTIVDILKKPFRKKDINQKNTETSLIEYFLYPKYGPGQLWTKLAGLIEQKGGVLYKNSRVVQLNGNGNLTSAVVATKNEKAETIEFDYCISTMPVKDLFNAFSFDIPSETKKIADNLIYRDFITIGILLNETKIKLDDNWIYIQENYVKVGRIQVFNNWSPYLVKEANTTWLGLEYFCNESDGIWELKDKQLIDLATQELIELGFIESQKNVLDAVAIKVPKTYPAYFGAYSEFFKVRAFTDTIPNLFLVGRNGMHKYNNQDHSMLTAMQAVQNIKKGITSKENIWAINTEEEYHEEKKR